MERAEILIGKGGDVGLRARTSKHILVFAFGYLSQLYSLYILIANIVHQYMLGIVFTLISIQESY